jgi:uncharacterized protein (DUF433 family)
MPVATIFENLEAGASIKEIAEWFDITPEHRKEGDVTSLETV